MNQRTDAPPKAGGNINPQIKSIVERVENLLAEKEAIAEDIRGVYTEAKGNGFDVNALRAVIRQRAMDAPKREALEANIEAYLHALGMI